MRNFGNDSFASQHHYLHHQLAPPPPHQHHLAMVPTAVAMPTTTHQPGKIDPYPLTKTVGVGTATATNLNKHNKSHFSPVSVIAPSSHHQNHLSGSTGHHNSNNNASANSTTTNNNGSGIPINHSHPHHHHAAVVATSAAGVSHLPTATLAAACPTPANGGPSPAHLQQIPVNGLPYHPSHSPTLPVPNAPLPSEIQGSGAPLIPSTTISSSSPTHSSQPPSNSGGHSPYHPPQYQITSFHKMQHRNASSSPTSEVSNGSQPAQPSSNLAQGSTSSKNEVTSGDNDKVNPAGVNGTTSNASAARIVSQNVNGTLSITGIPKNESELQLFRVLQRANLLSYFDMMIELGGDDVQQLCEAGEEEFLEIMALIGMAAKPLHVRRLQKALQEWMNQPSLFQSPVLPPGYQQQYAVSHSDRTISHMQYTSTTIATATSGHNNSGSGTTTTSNGSIVPLPHLISHNPVSPFAAHPAPSYSVDSANNTGNNSTTTSSPSTPRDSSSPVEVHPNKIVNSLHRSSSNNSPPLSAGGLHSGSPYIQHGSPSTIPVVISTPAQSYTCGQQQQNGNLSSLSGTATPAPEYYRGCPSPSGSSTVSIRSHHHQFPPHHYHHGQHAPTSPMENSPGSPGSSESGRCTTTTTGNPGGNIKHEEFGNSSELENASYSDHSNSIQSLDNSSGTTTRVASRSSSRCSSISCGSEPGSPPPPPPPTNFSRIGMLISSSSSQQPAVDSPRPSTESGTNRPSCSNNSVTVPSSQDLSSLQEHEIQKLAEVALSLVRSLPSNVSEPKLSRKIETSSYEFVLRLSEDDPRKMDEIRRLSAIFVRTSESGKRSKGSGSSGHKSNGPARTFSIHELVMNEAAAQLCKLVPALLTKRDELHSLVRQVVQESGLPYAIISANSNLPNPFPPHIINNNNNEVSSTSMRAKLDELRNSPASEERITHEFAAACKKIKLMESAGAEGQDSRSGMHPTENRSPPRRKPPPPENKIVTTTALKRMALVASEYRRNQNQVKSSVTVRT